MQTCLGAARVLHKEKHAQIFIYLGAVYSSGAWALPMACIYNLLVLTAGLSSQADKATREQFAGQTVGALYAKKPEYSYVTACTCQQHTMTGAFVHQHVECYYTLGTSQVSMEHAHYCVHLHLSKCVAESEQLGSRMGHVHVAQELSEHL